MTFTVFCLFAGIGGGALGFQRAVENLDGRLGRYELLGGVDVDPEVCADFTALTGIPATQLDLFSRADYIAFHGHEPPSDWREATPEDLRRAAHGRRPELVFTSAPCKGLSGLLPGSQAASPKYQALNRLTVRGIALTLAAWADDPPSLILFENVPRITSRGKHLLAEIKSLLTGAGYAFADQTHDLGEVGGLSQHRRRYLLVARHRAKLPAVLYRPPGRKVRAIGDALGPLLMPDDPQAGPMHVLPRLSWLTWVRLALIPAGGDWRDLQDIQPGRYAIEPDRTCYSNIYRCNAWGEPFGAVTSGKDQAVADARLDHTPRGGVYRVAMWDEPATTVIGNARPGGSNGMAAVADPRLTDRESRHPSTYKIQSWDEAADTVTGSRFGSGALAMADPRLHCTPRSGAYRIQTWSEPSSTVTANGDVHSQGAAAVADPRIPGNAERGVWVIKALDDTWHRPLTTLELAVLQGFPTRLPDGSPLVLAGKSQARWRERIGNAVPVQAAQAIAQAMLVPLMATRMHRFAWSVYSTAVWVRLLSFRRAIGKGGPVP